MFSPRLRRAPRPGQRRVPRRVHDRDQPDHHAADRRGHRRVHERRRRPRGRERERGLGRRGGHRHRAVQRLRGQLRRSRGRSRALRELRGGVRRGRELRRRRVSLELRGRVPRGPRGLRRRGLRVPPWAQRVRGRVLRPRERPCALRGVRRGVRRNPLRRRALPPRRVPGGAQRLRGACVDLESDPLHCGGCEHVCDSDELCVDSNCRDYAVSDCVTCPCASSCERDQACCAIAGFSAALCVEGGECPSP